MAGRNPSVEIIIPHYRGVVMLERCIESLAKTEYPAMDICIVDNGSGEECALAGLKSRFRRLRVISLPVNKGYAGGCNAALFSSPADYVVFLNDDAVVEPSWLESLVDLAEADATVAALQPKILSLQEQSRGKKVFDYAGGAGGLIDRLGYPYCRGRTLYRIEDDHGQYDGEQDVFWASGVAMFARKSVVADLGGFDKDFFMHMEEIDLCWRLLLKGCRIVSVPSSVVYHEGGASLVKGSSEKTYLNHRNNLTTLLKNRGTAALFWVLPFRLVLECVAVIHYLASKQYSSKNALAVLRALFYNMLRLRDTLKKRKKVQSMRVVPDSMLFRHAPFTILFSRSVPEEKTAGKTKT